MTQQPSEIPSDRSHVARIVALVVAAVLGLGLLAGGAWLALRGSDADPGGEQSAIEPAEETTGSDEPTGSASATPSVEPTASAEPSAPPPPAFTRNPGVAFRLGDSVYAAAADGTGAKALARSASGAFALSPDAATLALVDGGKLVVIERATGKKVVAGAAADVRPVWLPDSSAVMFIRMAEGGHGSSDVWRVNRDGSSPVPVHQGSRVAVSPDGRTLVVMPLQSGVASLDKGFVWVSRDGGAYSLVKVPGQPTAVAATFDRVLVGLTDAKMTARLVAISPDGRDLRDLPVSVSLDRPFSFGELLVTPDSARVVVTADGDDGFSRVYALPATGGATVPLSARRDAYPVGYTADGASLLFFEGNAFQGESSSLMRVRLDGTERFMVVSGAEP